MPAEEEKQIIGSTEKEIAKLKKRKKYHKCKIYNTKIK